MKEKKVFLFSGGFDSRLQSPYIDADVLLYVDMQGRYTAAELRELTTLPKNIQKKVKIAGPFNLRPFERDDLYLPFRNALLALIAAQYGQHIYFGFNESDNAPDKDETFTEKMQELLFLMGSEKYVPDTWVRFEGKKNLFDVTINMPFKKLTKTEMVAKYLADGKGSKKKIANIRSCYSGKSVVGCGKCAPCVHKAVALINNDIPIDHLFDIPITTKTIITWIDKHNYWRPGNRVIKDFDNALTRLQIQKQKR